MTSLPFFNYSGRGMLHFHQLQGCVRFLLCTQRPAKCNSQQKLCWKGRINKQFCVASVINRDPNNMYELSSCTIVWEQEVQTWRVGHRIIILLYHCHMKHNFHYQLFTYCLANCWQFLSAKTAIYLLYLTDTAWSNWAIRLCVLVK